MPILKSPLVAPAPQDPQNPQDSSLVAPAPQDPQDSSLQGDRASVPSPDNRPPLDPLQLDQLNARFLRQIALTETGIVVWRRSALSSPVCAHNPAKPSHPSHHKATASIAKLNLTQKAHLKAAAYWLHHYNPGAEATRSQQLEAFVEAHDQLVDAGAWSLVEQLLGELRSPLVTGSEALKTAALKTAALKTAALKTVLNQKLSPNRSQKALLTGFSQGLRGLLPPAQQNLCNLNLCNLNLRNLNLRNILRGLKSDRRRGLHWKRRQSPTDSKDSGQSAAQKTAGATPKAVNQPLALPIVTWHEQLGELGCYQEQVRIYRRALTEGAWREEQRLPLMLKLSRAYTELGQVQQAETWGRQALDLSKKLRDLSQEAEAWGVLGYIVMCRASSRQATVYFQRQLKLAQRLQSPLLLTRAWVNLAQACTHANPSQSLRCYRQAKKSLFKLRKLYNSDFYSRNHGFSGLKPTVATPSTLTTATGLGEQSLEPETPLGTAPSFFQSLSLQVQLGFAAALMHNNQDKAVIAQIQQLLPQIQAAGATNLEYFALYTLGNAYVMQRNWTMAEKTYQEAIALVRQYHYGSAEVYLLNSLGVTHCYFLKNYDKALRYLAEARQKTDILVLGAYKVILGCHIANCQRFMGNLAQAQMEHQQALDFFPQVQDITSRALICSNFAHWYWQEKRFLRCFLSLAHCFWLVPPWRSANGRLILRTAREVISKGIRQGWARLVA